MSDRGTHYSYTVYADPATARSFDQKRFGGPIGDLVAADQAAVLARFLEPIAGRSVLDVGTGTGRAAFLLAAAGASVTGIDASNEMLAVAREQAARSGADVSFRVCDAHHLEFADRSFDAAVSLRVLMHTPRWRTCVGELCRVARHRIVVDYPAASSVALLQSAMRKVVHRVGGRTEPYRVFRDADIARAFDAHGFRIVSRHRQFVLPIALHKAIGSRTFTVGVERLLARAGLLALLGSPVTIVAERCASS